MRIQRRILPRAGAILLSALLAVGLVPSAVQAHPGHEQDPEFRALLFTKTAGYRHDSIPAGVAAFEKMAADNHFEIDHTEDSSVFNDAALATYDVVIMFQTSGMVWQNDAERAAIQKYVTDGGGIAAVHNATDMGVESEFPWWDDLVNAGAHMPSHSPGVLQGTAKVVDKKHASTATLPERWNRAEEWYNFDQNIRGKAHVLVTADESTYNPGPDKMGADHPISWCRDVGPSKVWATAMGHPIGAYSEPDFLEHLLGGVRTAAGVVPSDCQAGVDSAYEKIGLDTNTKAPTAMDITPDGRVFYTEILGQVKMYHPGTGAVTTALDLPVYAGGEDGLVGVTVDPKFAENGWIYLYYSPPGTEEKNRISRFTVEGDVIVPTSEKTVIEVPASRREEPGHTGGYLTFGPQGDLYIGVGDDTNPFQSNGFSPIDERPGRDLFDAQKTAANTNDLRGKILRVTPKADGGYTVPEGNMFAPGTEKTKPEIYAMGFRNSFRFTVDTDGTIYAADYGPDSRTADPKRGPDGQVEWHIIKEPGFYGWPYCTGNNIPYIDYDFATGVSTTPFDCANVVNNSPNNTGLTQLPPSKMADVWYGYGNSANFPELGAGGSAPMGGPVYRYDPNLVSDVKWPEYFDGKAFFYEWARNKLYTFSLDGQGKVLKIDPLLPSQTTLAPMDMRFGPDGALYLLEWGGGYGRDNPDSGLYRIEHTQGNKKPVAKATASPSSGQDPLTVKFSSAGSNDPEGTALTYSWNFGDGAVSSEPNPTHTYTTRGSYNVQLTVTDGTGKAGVVNVPVSVGNTAPTVDVKWPVEGGMFDFGDKVAFDVDVTDPEDGQIDCAKVVALPSLGHDSHGHPLDPINACEGEFTTLVDEGHADANILYSLDASYTDGGHEGVPALTGRDIGVILPKHRQAEFFTSASGVRVVNQAGAESGRRIGDITAGDWIAFKPVNFHGIDQVSLRASAPAGAGGSVELRAGSTTGTLLATVPVPSTGGWDNYVQLPPVELADFEGTTELFMVFRGANSPFDLDSMKFIGDGVAVVDRQAPKTTATVSTVDGANGWHRTTPVITLTADDAAGSGVAGSEYRIEGGAWTPYTQPFAVPGEGERVVGFRSTDKKGNVEAEGTLTVRADAGAPALSVTGVEAKAYGDSAVLNPAWTAGDPVSGLDTVTALLDGQPVVSGAPLALYSLSLGAHELVVTAKDKAGNVTEKKFAFTVGTSLADLRALVDRFTAEGKIDQWTGASLNLTLTTAKFLQDRGSAEGAAAVLRLFKHTVERKVADPVAKSVLVRDADALIRGTSA